MVNVQICDMIHIHTILIEGPPRDNVPNYLKIVPVVFGHKVLKVFPIYVHRKNWLCPLMAILFKGSE